MTGRPPASPSTRWNDDPTRKWRKRRRRLRRRMRRAFDGRLGSQAHDLQLRELRRHLEAHRQDHTALGQNYVVKVVFADAGKLFSEGVATVDRLGPGQVQAVVVSGLSTRDPPKQLTWLITSVKRFS